MTLTGRRRAIGKDVAEMASAARAHFLHPDDSITGVAKAADVRLVVRLEEARPAGARIEFCTRAEKWQAAEAARIDSFAMIIEKHTAKGGLGTVLEQHTPLVPIESRDDLRALRFARRLQVELAHHDPPGSSSASGKIDCRAD